MQDPFGVQNPFAQNPFGYKVPSHISPLAQNLFAQISLGYKIPSNISPSAQNPFAHFPFGLQKNYVPIKHLVMTVKLLSSPNSKPLGSLTEMQESRNQKH